jgi:hypothetical protein
MIKLGLMTIMSGLLYLGVGLAAENSNSKEYNLTYKAKSGQKRKCTYELSVSGEVKVNTFERHPVMKFSSKVVRTINDQVLNVIAHPGGGIEQLKLKREYTSSVLTVLEPVKPADAMTPGPEMKKEITKPDALDKKTFEIYYHYDQGLSITPVTGAKLNKESAQKEPVNAEAQALIILHEGNFALFMPDKKVKVGEEWNVKSDAIGLVLLRQVLLLKDGRPTRYVHETPEVGMRFDLQDSSALRCTFMDVTKTDGIEYAKIKLDGKIIALQDKILNAEIDIEGFIWLALKDGVVRKVELDGDIKMDGVYPDKPTDKGMMLNCPVEGRGKMTLKLQSN